MILTYISLGSNLLSPIDQVNSAVIALKKIPKSHVLSISKYYCTLPLDNLNQPNYLNAAVALETDLNAYELLQNMQRIEWQQGRKRGKYRWESRTIDLDLMLFGNQVINTSYLTIPHYDMCNRGFMLWPLIEIAPQLCFPNGIMLQEVLARLDEQKPSYWPI